MEGWYLLDINQPTSVAYWWFIITLRIAWLCRRWIIQVSALSALMVAYWATMAITGNGRLGFDSGEGAWEMATTSKEGSRRVNYPILTQVSLRSKKKSFMGTDKLRHDHSHTIFFLLPPFYPNREVVTINNNAGPLSRSGNWNENNLNPLSRINWRASLVNWRVQYRYFMYLGSATSPH